jgi:transcriptional regulator with XRE-family HTH domain
MAVCAKAIVQTEVAESFGSLLYTLRKRLCITQRDAAARCSISKAYFGELENSKRAPPPLARVKKMGAALGASDQELTSLCVVARTERLTSRNLPADRPDLHELVQHLLLHGALLDTAQVKNLWQRVTTSLQPPPRPGGGGKPITQTQKEALKTPSS